MPRVHGINIAPRRGRGRGRSRPSATCVGGNVAATTTTVADGGSSVNFEETKEGESPGNPVKDIHGATLRMSLDGDATRENGSTREGNLKSPAASTCMAHSRESLETEAAGTTKEQTMPATSTKPVEADKTNSTIDSSTSFSAPTTTTPAVNGKNIRPQARESLNYLDFGSHSFSVQKISHKSPRKFNSNNIQFSSVGLAPSLDPIAEVPTAVPATSQLPSAETKTIPEKNDTLLDQQLTDKTNLASETAELMSKESPESKNNSNSIDASRHSKINSNARWLYHRCSKACTQMKTLLSPLELAIKTLQAIRSIRVDDDFGEHLQQILFAVLREGKRRDLDFMFEVSEKALELREDELLDERSLQEVAVIASSREGSDQGDNCEVDDDSSDDELIDALEMLATQPIEPSTIDDIFTKSLNQSPGMATPQISNQELQQTAFHSTTDGDSPRKSHRSRRKKRPTQNTAVADNATHKGVIESSHTNAPNGASKRESTTEFNNEAMNSDFPMMKDAVDDMQDDEKWSFLPSAQLPSIEERDEDGGQTPRRVTRSMGLTDGDDDGVENSIVESPKNRKSLEMSRKAELPENTEESNENQDNTIQADENTNVMEDITREPDEKSMVENAAGSNEKQDEVLIMNDKPDVAENKPCSSGEKAAIENTARGGENLRKEIKAYNKTGAMESKPLGFEKSTIDDEEVYTNVKNRKRGECKDVVRIMFTGITPTRRHYQVSVFFLFFFIAGSCLPLLILYFSYSWPR